MSSLRFDGYLRLANQLINIPSVPFDTRENAEIPSHVKSRSACLGVTGPAGAGPNCTPGGYKVILEMAHDDGNQPRCREVAGSIDRLSARLTGI